MPAVLQSSRRVRRKVIRLVDHSLRRAVKAVIPPAQQAFQRRVLNREHHDPLKQIDVKEVCLRIVALAQAMRERQFYPYQVDVSYRVCESLLLHDGSVVTVLMARQSGKTELIGAIVAAIAVIFPKLAADFPESWHLNMTDDRGVYRGYKFGIAVGIYAPRLDQSGIMFDRVKTTLTTNTSKKILKELGAHLAENNGNTVKVSNGSSVLCESASEQSKIEGATHGLLIIEEAQDVTDQKVRRSLHPMVAATGGTIVKVGTATTQKCDFYSAIKQNQRAHLVNGIRDHFFFPYTVGLTYNSLYKKIVEQEKIRLGEESDEFRTSYKGEFIFERGMFVTMEQLFHTAVAQSGGVWAERKPFGIDPKYGNRYSVVAGIDWGASHDSTVVTTMAVDWNNPVEENESFTAQGTYRYSYFKKHILDWLEYVGDNYETQFWNVIAYLSKVKGLKAVVTDSNTCGKPIYDRMVATLHGSGIEVREFNYQAKLKSDGYKLFYSDICGRRLTFPAGQGYRDSCYHKFVNQMLDLRKTYKNGLMCVAHPEEKGAHDDFCLLGSSLVLTQRGDVPILQVTTNDFVMTRQGWKKVLVSHQTGIREVIRVGNLVATPEHPFFCVNKSLFIPLDQLSLDDTVLSCESNSSSQSKFESTKVCATSDTGAQKLFQIESIFSARIREQNELTCSIESFGKIATGLFRRAWSSITKMMMLPIIGSAIWKCSLSVSMLSCTCASQNDWLDAARQSELPSRLPSSLLIGSRLLGEKIRELKQLTRGLFSRIASWFAPSAETHLRLETTPTPKLVPVTVRLAAGDASTLREFESLNGRPVSVPVYNLQVADVPEFVCQGVLVHNSDSAMQASWGCNQRATLGDYSFDSSNPFFH